MSLRGVSRFEVGKISDVPIKRAICGRASGVVVVPVETLYACVNTAKHAAGSGTR